MPRRQATVFRIISCWVDERRSLASLGASDWSAEELRWLREDVLRDLLRPRSSTNRSFFLALANLKDAEGLLKWFLILISDPEERNKVRKAARRVYGAGQPPFQPKLLAVLDEFK